MTLYHVGNEGLNSSNNSGGGGGGYVSDCIFACDRS